MCYTHQPQGKRKSGLARVVQKFRMADEDSAGVIGRISPCHRSDSTAVCHLTRLYRAHVDDHP